MYLNDARGKTKECRENPDTGRSEERERYMNVGNGRVGVKPRLDVAPKSRTKSVLLPERQWLCMETSEMSESRGRDREKGKGHSSQILNYIRRGNPSEF